MRPSLHRLARHAHTHDAGEGEEEEEVGVGVGVVEEVDGEGQAAPGPRTQSIDRARPPSRVQNLTGSGPGGRGAHRLREELPWRLRCV